MSTKAARAALHPAEQYARDVAAGRVVASKFVVLACERHLRDLRDAHKRGLRFDPAAAARVIEFFGLLRHYRGAEWTGEPFVLGAWQQFILWTVFGWKKADGLRRFRTVHVEVGKGNGKTPLGAGIGLYMMMADGEPGAEVYCVATKKDQARILHSDANGFRDKSPGMAKRIQKFRDNLCDPIGGGKFEPLGADQDTLDGLRPYCLLLDELHAWRTRALLDVLEEGLDKCPQSLAFRLTTAGPNLIGTVYTEEHEYAERILASSDPAEDDSFFAFIASIDEGDDWQDEKNWPKANPNLGVSVRVEDLRVKAKKAASEPSYLNSFLRFRMNVRTHATTAAINMQEWNACVGFELAGTDPKKLREQVMTQFAAEKRRCFAALDLSSKVALSSLVLAFEPEAVTEPWILIPFFWMPEGNVAKLTEKHRFPYDRFQREGFIHATPGNFIDQDFIVSECERLVARFHFAEDEKGHPEVAMDPFNSSQVLVDLQNLGFVAVEFRQGWKSMSEPTKSFLGMIPAKRIAHLANPVLSLMAQGFMTTMDPKGNVMPTKEDEKKPNDGIVAGIMAVGRGMSAPDDGGGAYDDGREILVV